MSDEKILRHADALPDLLTRAADMLESMPWRHGGAALLRELQSAARMSRNRPAVTPNWETLCKEWQAEVFRMQAELSALRRNEASPHPHCETCLCADAPVPHRADAPLDTRLEDAHRRVIDAARALDTGAMPTIIALDEALANLDCVEAGRRGRGVAPVTKVDVSVPVPKASAAFQKWERDAPQFLDEHCHVGPRRESASPNEDKHAGVDVRVVRMTDRDQHCAKHTEDMAVLSEAMRPQLETVLAQFSENLLSMLEETSSAEIDRCIKAVEACRMTCESPIGPQHGAGWNAALDCAESQLRSWKARAREASSDREEP